MTASPATAKSRGTANNALTAGQLPKRVPLYVAIASLVVGAGIVALTAIGSPEGGFNYGGALILAAILYLVAITVISRSIEGGRKASDRFVTGLVVIAFVIAMLPLLSLIVMLLVNGLPRLVDPGFYANDMSRVSRTGGGAVHAIVGTLLITLVTTLIAVPIGLFTAIYLVEYANGNALSRWINTLVDVMTGIPSIVAGLFAFALMAAIFTWTGQPLTSVKFGFTGAIALSVLMIPTVVRSAEEMLRLVPNELREASLALGVPRWRTIAKVVLPTALAGLVTGTILAIARVIGETAPLLVTAGFANRLNTDLLNGQMTTLPVFVYQLIRNTTGAPELVANAEQLAWAGALALLVIVMLLNLIGRLITYYFAPKGGR